MITLGNLYRVDPEKYDEVWVICRSVHEIEDWMVQWPNVKHVPQLSPSPELFRWYRDRVHDGKWGEEAFQKGYVPVFLSQMAESAEARMLLEQLKEDSRRKNIVLVCFCEDETLCHRSIVGGVLANAGADILCDSLYPERYCL